MDSYLGIDYGGTKLLIGEVSADGTVLSHMRFETGKRGQREIREHLLECLEVYKHTARYQGIPRAAGVGIIGVSDNKKGIWRSFNHEPGEDMPLAKEVSGVLGIPAAIDNDVRSAVTAELLWGCGRYSRDFLYVSAGTGLAAGMVIDGRIIRGANQNAGEIGHCTVRTSSDRECGCTRQGCAELSASGMGISAAIRSGQGKYPTALKPLGEQEAADVREVFALCRQGDALCRKVTEEAEQVLAEVIENLVRTSDPDTVILGGGIMQDTWFLEGVKARLHPVTMRGVKNGVRLSSLKPELAGLLGAAAVGKLYAERNGYKNENYSDGK